MTTASDAFAAIKTRLTNNKPSGLTFLVWQNEDPTALPDTPAAFAYVEFLVERSSGPAAFGGGAGRNLYRNPARVVVFVFVPRGKGLVTALDLAEQVATLFRSYRDNAVSCFEAVVQPGGDGAEISPPGMASEVNNYYWATVDVSLYFDQIG